MQLIKTIHDMREREVFINGEAVEGAPRMYVGAAANPFAEPYDFRPLRLA